MTTNFNELFAIVNPFFENNFMQLALGACCLMSLSAAPLGVFLSFKRMSLTGDALGHALLPGAAVGYLLFGLNVSAMTIGGLITGVMLALASSFLSFRKRSAADSSLAALYLISLSLGVVLVSFKGTQVDLMHFLFGHILAVDPTSLYTIGGVAIFSLGILFLILKALLLQVSDPTWARFRRIPIRKIEFVFLFLVVLNLVAAFQVLGTLMAVGLMILPGVSARLWSHSVLGLLGVSILIAIIGCFIGLCVSFYLNLPSGPTIVLTLGLFYLLSAARQALGRN
jgi:zinc/manganese transport system permease protein